LRSMEPSRLAQAHRYWHECISLGVHVTSGQYCVYCAEATTAHWVTALPPPSHSCPLLTGTSKEGHCKVHWTDEEDFEPFLHGKTGRAGHHRREEKEEETTCKCKNLILAHTDTQMHIAQTPLFTKIYSVILLYYICFGLCCKQTFQ